jgi:hypothetical protein
MRQGRTTTAAGSPRRLTRSATGDVLPLDKESSAARLGRIASRAGGSACRCSASPSLTRTCLRLCPRAGRARLTILARPVEPDVRRLVQNVVQARDALGHRRRYRPVIL